MERHPTSLDRGSTVGRAILEGKPVQIPDVLADAEYKLIEAQKLGGWRATLAVPLLRDGQPIGAISLIRTAPRPFTERQIELITTFADQAVIAIENTRLFEAEQARTRELTKTLERQTATTDILSVISRSPTDAQPVFDIIGERAQKLCDAKFSVVSMVDGELMRLVSIHGLSNEGAQSLRSLQPLPVDTETLAGLRSAVVRSFTFRTFWPTRTMVSKTQHGRAAGAELSLCRCCVRSTSSEGSSSHGRHRASSQMRKSSF
jgi:hypothetical protein